VIAFCKRSKEKKEAAMRIGIVGAGHIGSTVGKLWCEAGHEVRFGTRHPDALRDLVTSLGARASAGTPRDAANFGEIVLLAVPMKATPALANEIGPALRGKTVLDATNPYPDRDGEVAREAIAEGHGSSAWTAERLPGARVVKAFNMQRYTALESEAHVPDDPLAIALAGDDVKAVADAEELVRQAGFEPVVVGDLEHGRSFDPGTPHYANGVHAAELRKEVGDLRYTKPARTSAGKAPPRAYEGFDHMPIAGEWRRGTSGKRGKDVDPWTGETLVEIPLAGVPELDEAYRAAATAQRHWAARLPHERAEVMVRAAEIMKLRREEIIGWIMRESGGTRIKAELEHQLVLAGLVEASTYPAHVEGRILPADVPGKESRVYRFPAGVVGVISPWNFPLQLSNRSVAPALALGNAVVLKPASDTPVTGGLLLARILEEAGLPLPLLSVIIGAGEDIGDAFVEHPVPRVISFTGSTAVGRHIGELAGRALKKVCLELGGNGPLIVLEDADIDLAVHAALVGKFMHQGQICMAVNRILVDAAVYDVFVERFAQGALALKTGDRDDPETVIGPIINRAQLESIETKVEATIAAGARAVVRGDTKGLVMPPVVLVDVTRDMPCAREEIFGPVAPILRVQGEEDAIRIANDTEYGLSSAIFTRDAERGVRLAKRIQAGMTHINDMPVNDEPNTAFGGEKASGLGRFGGKWAIQELTTDRWISIQSTPRAYPF
jgi:aldehyde dehydrogenase (NAD+)